MNEFAGLIRLDGEAVDGASAARLGRAILSPRPPIVWRPDPTTIFVEARTSDAPAPLQAEPGRVLLADVWLDSAEEAAAALGLDRVPADRALAAAACARWGVEAAAQRLSGDYAFACWDQEARRLTLARDAFGGRPVYYVATPRFILFATSLQAMLAMPEAPRELDEVVVADTMAIALQDQERTIYRHIRRAPPGGVAVFERGTVSVSRWFTIQSIAPVRLANDAAYVEAARALLDSAVARRLPRDGLVASELSGGFDSAAVTATAARLLGERRLTAFTRVGSVPHPEHEVDERGLAGLLVDRHPNIDWRIIDGMHQTYRESDPESEAAATLVPRLSSFNASWFETLSLEVERSGAAVLLNGGAGNMSLSYEGVPSLAVDFRRAGVSGAVRGLRGAARARRQSLPHAFASQLFGEFAPRALKRWRLERRQGSMPWLRYSVVSPDFLADLAYADHARELGHDIPFQLPYDQRETRLRMLQAQRARDFAGYARRKLRVPRRDPLIDRRLVEFCFAIPDDQYWREGQSRWLARRVLADRVPAETLAKRVLGRQSPDWYGLASRRRDEMAAAIDRIARSPLASRVLDVPRMRALLDNWPKDAESADKSVMLHGHALQRGIAMGGFLRWHEGRND